MCIPLFGKQESQSLESIQESKNQAKIPRDSNKKAVTDPSMHVKKAKIYKAYIKIQKNYKIERNTTLIKLIIFRKRSPDNYYVANIRYLPNGT